MSAFQIEYDREIAALLKRYGLHLPTGYAHFYETPVEDQEAVCDFMMGKVAAEIQVARWLGRTQLQPLIVKPLPEPLTGGSRRILEDDN